jgi:hypothetical protein
MIKIRKKLIKRVPFDSGALQQSAYAKFQWLGKVMRGICV